MTQAIIYCERCGKIIPPSEIGGGKAIVGENAGVCPGCASQLPAKEIEEIRRKLSGEPEPEPRAAAAGGASGRRSSARPGQRRADPASARAEPAAAPSSLSGLAIAGMVAGVLVGLAVTLLVIGKGRKKPSTRPGGAAPRRAAAPRGAQDPRRPIRVTPPPPGFRPAPAAPATPAAKRLAEIKDVFTPWFSDYTEGRKILRAFLKEFPDGPEAAKAKERLAEMSIGETTRAKTELAKATKRAEVLSSLGKFDKAAKVLEAVRERFAENEWFKTEGEKKIASALEGMEKSRLDAAVRTIAEAGRLVEAKRFDEADRALAGRA
ncbi:MAG: tetratricopeptide repeat protein, partial [Planctomycetota bacterium]